MLNYSVQLSFITKVLNCELTTASSSLTGILFPRYFIMGLALLSPCFTSPSILKGLMCLPFGKQCRGHVYSQLFKDYDRLIDCLVGLTGHPSGRHSSVSPHLWLWPSAAPCRWGGEKPAGSCFLHFSDHHGAAGELTLQAAGVAHAGGARGQPIHAHGTNA